MHPHELLRSCPLVSRAYIPRWLRKPRKDYCTALGNPATRNRFQISGHCESYTFQQRTFLGAVTLPLESYVESRGWTSGCRVRWGTRFPSYRRPPCSWCTCLWDGRSAVEPVPKRRRLVLPQTLSTVGLVSPPARRFHDAVRSWYRSTLHTTLSRFKNVIS